MAVPLYGRVQMRIIYKGDKTSTPISNIQASTGMYYSGDPSILTSPNTTTKFIQMSTRSGQPKYTMGENLKLTSRSKQLTEFVSNRFASSNGSIGLPTVSITMTSEVPIDYFYIDFSEAHQEYATSLLVYTSNGDSYTIDNDKLRFEYEVPAPATSISVIILTWSRPFVSPKVSSVSNVLQTFYRNFEYEGEPARLYEMQLGRQSQEQATAPSFGVNIHYGSVSFEDFNDNVRGLMESNELQTNLLFDFQLDNKPIGSMIGNFASLDVGSKTAHFELNSVNFNMNTQYPSIGIDNYSYMTGNQLWTMLKRNSENYGYIFNDLDNTVLNYLVRYSFETNFILDIYNLGKLWKDFLFATNCIQYVEEDGTITTLIRP